ncbi:MULTISPECIES: sodium-dependent transporter [Lachnospiraceae]|uniref:Transporter n=1 Tax=Faecalicatena acetigenes TaxID=2981790 RepID=A0ABT2TEN4_9FIRM|nr:MULTISPECIES: sodium-dependent transporter [Lachnospiraceae]MCU6748272.1 sodium-dependent transporter [Faecalicatena acetigenes]RGT71494.1 sodium-dependent transporter [Ruminococcus sp. AF18-22]SCI35394.1 Na+-dependent transporters of the SNF family [uncultured Clostridium sp.]
MKREKFGSRLGFILVSAGCAIGLGNVWKFPYMTGRYGGAAFILIYLLFLIILGMPIIVCEFSVGRASQKSIATSYNALEPPHSRWHYTRWFAIAGNYILVMFYSCVGGWMLYYCFRMAKGEFVHVTSAQVAQKYDAMLQSPYRLLFWTVIVILIAFGICSIGLQKGVEKIMKITMLCLLAIMIILAVRSVTLSGSAEGLKFYLIPDFERMKASGIGNVIFGAMSQAFFTLSIGMGGMAIFGSYLDKSRSLTGESLSIVLLDTFVALTAGLIVIPACFAFNVEPDVGPGLVFVTLPNIFSQMPGGRLWGALFFLFLFFAALSTIVGVFENIVSFGIDLFHFSRTKSVGINIVLITLLNIPCILGFNILSEIQPLGAGTNIMDLEDFLVSNNILPLGSVVYLLFCTHKNGWGWKNFIQEANSGEGLKFPQFIRGYMTYVLPWIVVIIYLKGYYDMFSKQSTSVFVIWMLIAFSFLFMILAVSRKKSKL